MKFAIGNQPFETSDLAANSLPRQALEAAVYSANNYALAKVAVTNDNHLSGPGKTAKLAPQADALWQQIFASLENIESERLHLAGRQSKLYAIPPISTPFEISMDRERRDWFRGLPLTDQTRVLAELKSGDEHKELVNSLLRSPVPLKLDILLEQIQAIHQENCQAAYPEEWALIQTGQQSVAGAQRGMAHVAGIAHGLTERQLDEVLRQALRTGHERAAHVLADAQMVAQVRERMKVAALQAA